MILGDKPMDSVLPVAIETELAKGTHSIYTNKHIGIFGLHSLAPKFMLLQKHTFQ